jgi:uncharacterized protein YlxP (DUF503 family)
MNEDPARSLFIVHHSSFIVMIVGSLRVRLLLRESRSLKDKRQVVRSIKDRLRNEFNVSVAEVEELDNRQLAVLGVAMVSNEGHHVRTALEQIVTALRSHPVAEFLDHELEV